MAQMKTRTPRMRPNQGARKGRYPVHSFYVEPRPFEIQPICLAPVLAGDTLKNLQFQARVVTDPIANGLIGWWAETYWFYVAAHKCGLDTETSLRTEIETAFLDPTASITNAPASTINARYETTGAPINWVELCLKKVTTDWFRREGEAWNDYKSTATFRLPAASAAGPGFIDSLVTDTDYQANVVADETISTAGDNAFTISELQAAWDRYNLAKQMNLAGGADLTFDEWIRMQGIRVPDSMTEDQDDRCELLRYTRDWQYPSNTINASTGAPSSAVSWALRGRADKDRFFRWPGFIFGVMVIRPKVYHANQTGHASALLTQGKHWVPMFGSQEPGYSFTNVSAAGYPYGVASDAYWMDMRDLFLYGDQFVGISLSETDSNLVALPTAALQKRYCASTDVDNLFATKTADVGKVMADGIVDISIMSRIVDESAMT